MLLDYIQCIINGSTKNGETLDRLVHWHAAEIYSCRQCSASIPSLLHESATCYMLTLIQQGMQ